MPSFVYQARDAKGERVSGAREAASQQEALDALRATGLFVTKLLAANSKEAKEIFPNGAPPDASTHQSTSSPKPLVEKVETPVSRPSFEPLRKPERAQVERSQVENPKIPRPETPKPHAASTPTNPVILPSQALPPLPPRYHLRSNSKDLALFWSQMNSMLSAGVALSHATKTMAANAPNIGLRTACEEISPRIASGVPFSELMLSYPGIFSPLMIGMIRAGEAGGFLDRMCKRLSEYSERDYHIQQTIKRETWYPKLLFVCSLLIPTIIPAAIAYFRDNQSFLAVWIRAAFMPLTIIVLIALAIRFKNYLTPLTKHLKPFQLMMDQVKLLIPIGGKSTRGLATAKFCRALGALQAAGMGVHQTINLSADACGNSIIAESSRGAIKKLEAGASMTEALESTRQFPGIAIQMLRTGEATGNFEDQLDKVADFLESDAETTIKQAVVVLGIVMFLVMAIYIGISVGSMYIGTYTNMMDQGEALQE